MRQRFTQFRRRRERSATEPSAPLEAESDTEADTARDPEPRRPALVVGLGNPGERYAWTRHNVGLWCIRLLARRHGAQLERRGKLDAATITIEGHELTLARPRTYVNDSGPPVAAEARRLAIPATRVLVIFDDLDLPVARVRMRAGGGSGGNNGMKSLIAALGTREFARLRIGIDRPYDAGAPVRDPDRVAGWVLSAPGSAEREQLHAAVERAADAVETAVYEGIETAMNRVNAGG